MATDHDYMQKAYELAQISSKQNEVPVGALLVKDDIIIAKGYNQVLAKNDPTAHAEIEVLRAASLKLNNFRLNNTTLYVTLEPCAMCAGALVNARIKRLVFACRDLKTGACGSTYQLLKGYPLNHKIIVDEGIMARECGFLIQSFFKKKRNSPGRHPE